MCLTETYNEVRIGEHLCDAVPDYLKQGAALLSRGPYFWKENPKHTF
jgi:hypothetical protein